MPSRGVVRRGEERQVLYLPESGLLFADLKENIGKLVKRPVSILDHDLQLSQGGFQGKKKHTNSNGKETGELTHFL